MGGVDCYVSGFGWMFDQDFVDVGLSQFFVQYFVYFQVGCQVISEFGFVGVLFGVLVFGNVEVDINWMNFMIYGFFFICLFGGVYNYSDVVGVFEDVGIVVFCLCYEMFQGWIFINYDGLNFQFVDVGVLVVFGVGNC